MRYLVRFTTCFIIFVGGAFEAHSQSLQKLSRQYSLSKRDQYIDWGQIERFEFKMGKITYGLKAESSCGLPLEYTSSDTSVAEIRNSELIIKSAGKVVITATQGGNNYFNPMEASREIILPNKPEKDNQ